MYLQNSYISDLMDRFGGFTYDIFRKHLNDKHISAEIMEPGRQIELVERDQIELIKVRHLPSDSDDNPRDPLIALMRTHIKASFDDAERAEKALARWRLKAMRDTKSRQDALVKLYKTEIQLIAQVQRLRLNAINALMTVVGANALNEYLTRNGAPGDIEDEENFKRAKAFAQIAAGQPVTAD